MKCPNCNVEIEDGSAFCIFCGSPTNSKPNNEEVKSTEEVIKNEEDTPITEEKNEANDVIVEEKIVQEEVEKPQPEVKEEEKEQVIEKKVVEPAASTPNSTTTKNTPNKKRHSLITIAILGIAMLLVVIVIVAFLTLSGSPEKLYKAMVTKATNSMLANEFVTSEKANMTASVEISTDIEELEEMLDGLAVSANMQYDYPAKEIIAKAKIDKGSESYLDGQMFINLLEKKIYFSENNLFDKLISMEIPEDSLTQMEEMLGEEDLIIETSAAKTAAKRMAKAINDNLDKEYFSSQKVVVNINGKEKKVKDNAFVLTGEQFKEVFINVCNTLIEDEKFLECYKNGNDIKEALEYIVEEMEYASDEGSIEVHYYTSGLFNTFVGTAVVVTDEYDDQTVLEVISQDNDVYEVALKAIEYGEEEELLALNIKANKIAKNEVDVEVELDIEDVGSLVVKVVTNTIFDKDIEPLDIGNAVDVNDLTEDDITKIAENLENSALYTLIEAYMEEDTTPDYEEEEIQLPAGVTLKEGQSCVMTYDDDVVKFDVPSTFEEDYGGNSYRAYTKKVGYNYAGVDVDAEYTNVDDYTQVIEDSLDYLSELDGYKDMQITDVEEVEVNGVTFKKRTTSYTSYSNDYSFTYVTTYYYTAINDEYTYVVAVEDEDNIVTENEIKKFLTIEL